MGEPVKRGINRRTFLQWSIGAMMTVASQRLPVHTRGQDSRGRVRVRLTNPDHARRTDIQFCRRAEFDSAADAVRAIRQRRMEAELYQVSLSDG